MIKIVLNPMKKSGGPGIFVHRLMDYMQKHNMIRVVEQNGDIYFTTVWLGDPPKRTKIVYRAASVYYNTHEKKRNKKLNIKIANAINKANYVIYQSKFGYRLSRKLLKMKCPYHKIIVNGFDASAYQNIEPRKFDNNGPVFVSSADWTERAKRGRLIIDCFRRAEIPNSRLLMIGKKNDDFQKYDNVEYLGKLMPEDISSILKSRPIFVHMCFLEVCPNAVIEALSYGCPVLCNNIGGTPEIVGESGIAVNCDRKFKFKRYAVDINNVNYDAIVDGLRNILNQQWDIHRDDLSMEKCANEYLSAFQSCLSI